MIPYNSPITSMPSQMIPYAKKIAKGKKWAKECVDTLEQLGRRQYVDNLRFVENYQMLNGRFIAHHYFQEEGYKDMITALSRELEIPSTLRHYDILGKLVNNLTEKLVEFPDVFRVQEMFEEGDTNEYTRTQTDLMHQTVKKEINDEITARLLAEGLDPSKQDFQSEEEAVQYQQELQAATQAMTPSQINTYMATDWQSQGEIWGNHQLTVDKQRFKLDVLERLEFRDMLITDRCIRHFYLTGNGYNQETWNPLNTFFHISPDVDWIELGDYAGRLFYLTLSDVINRYGWKMNQKQLDALEKMDNYFNKNLDFNGFPYKTYAPFEDFKAYDIIRRGSGYDPIQKLPIVDDSAFLGTGSFPYLARTYGLYRITECYWKSQAKIGKVVYLDPETGVLTKDIVDENFVVPENFEEVTGDFYEGNEINTVYWTWTNQVWKGTKIIFDVAGSAMSNNQDDAQGDLHAIYLDLEPCEFQFKGDYDPYNCKLPICGRIFNNRNAQSMGFVDMAKPHQVGYNVAMNQLYQLLEKEEGKFMIWDVRFFNNLKDWGGEDSFDKIKLIAKELGHVFGDTSPQNMVGGGANNTLPREANMELTAQIFSRAKIAEFFENRMIAQLGITPQSIGDVKATETATGINTAVSQTSLNVQRYYTDFFEYKQRCLTMDLDIAQFVQSQKKDFLISYIKSDQSRAYIQIKGKELLLRDLNTHVVNSQQLLRQIEQLRGLFLNNNTTDASALDIAEVIVANSPSQILVKLKESQARHDDKEERQFQAEQANAKAQQELQQVAIEKQDAQKAAELETKKEVAYINTFSRQPNNLVDTNADKVPDALEYSKFNSQVANDAAKLNLQREQNLIDREKNADATSLKSRELDIREKALDQEEKRTETLKRISKGPKKSK